MMLIYGSREFVIIVVVRFVAYLALADGRWNNVTLFSAQTTHPENQAVVLCI